LNFLMGIVVHKFTAKGSPGGAVEVNHPRKVISVTRFFEQRFLFGEVGHKRFQNSRFGMRILILP
jgi:hypothetical protein